MAIADKIAQIRQAVYGIEVREAIAGGIEECYSDVQEGVTAADAAASAANTAATSANTAAGTATSAASSANTATTAANTATTAANTATTAANTAAAKIDNMTVSASGLNPGSNPTAVISEDQTTGYKHISFGLVKGDPGKDFRIAKTFASIAAMQAYSGSDIEAYDFAMIDTGSVQDADTGKLYCYEPETQEVWRYIGDLSGAQGIKGEKGDTGDPGPKGDKGDPGSISNVYGSTLEMSPSDSTTIANAISGKVSAAQGSANAGKILGINSEGNVVPVEDGSGDIYGNTIEMTSTDSTKVATAIGTKADKVTGATDGNFAALDANGNLTDSGKKASDFATSASLSNKANKADTVLSTTLSRGRKASTTVGEGSFAFGYNVTASGQYSHAEGRNTTAQAGDSHAEGFGSSATGSGSHAQGYYTTASGSNSCAEGYFTKAKHQCQHVSGAYNVDDPSTATAMSRGTYVEIVGNGTASDAKSNARALDWNGNEYLDGTLYVNCNADSTGGSEVATKTDLTSKVNVAQGVANAGKVLGVNASGNVEPVEQSGGGSSALTPSTAFSIPSSGDSVTYSMEGMTANHQLVRWNFSNSAENNPPASLTWSTTDGRFTITNVSGTTDETIQPVFVGVTSVAITAYVEPEG